MTKENKKKLKLFFRKHSTHFPQTYEQFSNIFKLESINAGTKSYIIRKIRRKVFYLFGDHDIKTPMYIISIIMFHLIIFHAFFTRRLDLDIIYVLENTLGWIVILNLLYLVYLFLTSSALSDQYDYLTREWDKARRVFEIVDSIVISTVGIFYFFSWVLLILDLFDITIVQDYTLTVNLLFLPPILLYSIPLIEYFTNFKKSYYVKYLLYLCYLFVLHNYNKAYKKDLYYYFKRFLLSLSNSLIKYFGFKIKNRDRIENKYNQYILKELKSYNIKKLGIMFKSLLIIGENLDIRFRDEHSVFTIQRLVIKLEEILEIFGIKEIELQNITLLEKLEQTKLSKINSIFKIVVPTSIIGVIFALIRFSPLL